MCKWPQPRWASILGVIAVNACAVQYGPKNTFNVTDFGAIADSAGLCTESIQRAIDACAAAGGGRVLLPTGTYLSGAIVLKSRVNLHLDKGAVMRGSPWIRDYPSQALRSRAHYDRFLKCSLVLAQGADCVSVSGEGTLDGNSRAENDFISESRVEKHRPCLIWFDECTNVEVKGVTFTSSGFWTQNYTRCRNVR